MAERPILVVDVMTGSAGRSIMKTVAQPLVDRAEAATTPPMQLPPPNPVIVPATDLGGVGVLKHGNLFLLSDPFGDIHPDSRGLGLYDLDTRVLSCAVLRINGVRPTLRRTQAAANHIATIQLTNPELRRDPSIKNDIGAAVASRAISVMRRRWIGGGLAERIEVTNYSAFQQRIELDLELDADAADIFEVRGRIRERRGTFLPTEATPESITFAYEGLDGFIRRTLVTMTAAQVSASRDDPVLPHEGSVRIKWVLEIEAGGRTGVTWEVATELSMGHARATEEIPTRLAQSVTAGKGGRRQPTNGTSPRAVKARAGAGGDGSESPSGAGTIAPPAEAEAEYGTWQERCARIRSDGELLDLAIRRSIADLRLLRNDGPNHGEHYVAAGVPWFATLFGRDSLITSLQVLPFMPDVARETLRVLADWRHRHGPLALAECHRGARMDRSLRGSGRRRLRGVRAPHAAGPAQPGL